MAAHNCVHIRRAGANRCIDSDRRMNPEVAAQQNPSPPTLSPEYRGEGGGETQGGRSVMFVLPADRKLSSKAVRAAKGWKSLRFAERDEVGQLTGLTPGSIPPFGSLFGLATYCDERLGEHERINFNAGDHAISVSLRYNDYVAVEQPELGCFAE